MVFDPNDGTGPATNGTGSNVIDTNPSTVPPDRPATPHIDTVSACSTRAVAGAHAVLVWTPDDRYTRRIFLSLHAADKAMARAVARGQTAALVMVELVPVSSSPVVVVGGDVR